MKKLSFKIDVYDWEVYLYQLEAKDSVKDVTKVLQKHNIFEDIYDKIVQGVEDGDYDGGWNLCDSGIHQNVIIFDQFSSRERKIEVYTHEKRHLEDDIAKATGLENNGEAIAYLAGYLATEFIKLSDKVKTYKRTSNGKNKKKR